MHEKETKTKRIFLNTSVGQLSWLFLAAARSLSMGFFQLNLFWLIATFSDITDVRIVEKYFFFSSIVLSLSLSQSVCVCVGWINASSHSSAINTQRELRAWTAIIIWNRLDFMCMGLKIDDFFFVRSFRPFERKRNKTWKYSYTFFYFFRWMSFFFLVF